MLLVIPHKNAAQRFCQQFCQHKHTARAYDDKQKTLFPQAFQFSVVSRTIMVSYNGRSARGISNKNSKKNEVYIHQDAVSGNTVLSRISDKLAVVKHTDN